MRLLPIRPDHGRRRAPREDTGATDTDIDQAMSGNICRCGTYGRIREAVKLAARKPATTKKEG